MWLFYGCSERQLGTPHVPRKLHLICKECGNKVDLPIEIGHQLVLPECSKCSLEKTNESKDHSSS